MSTAFKKKVKKLRVFAERNFRTKYRDPRNVFIVIFGVIIFLFCYAQALNAGLFDSFERPLFEAINGLPHSLQGTMFAITQFGGMTALVVWGGLAWYLINRRAMLLTVLSGWAGWTLAKIVKASVERGRPGAFFDKINLFNGETFGGYGFPSGHATLSAACAAALYYQLPQKYRKYLLFLVLLVGISRMYLGAHFPLDILGGWALGALCGALVSLLFGTSKRGIPSQTIKKLLHARGYSMTTVHAAHVDAKGSVPYFMEDASGKQYFAKIFGDQEHAADWLFKVTRFFRYKNFRGEEPYIYSKRNIEMESFATLWAREAGARVTRISDIIPVQGSWLLLQERVAGMPMSDRKTVSNEVLRDAWKQVAILHTARIAHRDLRATNILVDRQGKAWLIDFGFAEVSAPKERLYMDNAELMASMALCVGVERTVTAAFDVLSASELARTLPYLQPAVFSGATLKGLKSHKPLLKKLQERLHEALGIEETVETAPITRISWKKTINFGLLAIFLYVIVPQMKEFQGVFHTLDHLNWQWAPVLAVGSLLTYFLTGLIYVVLANVPLRVIPTAIAQLAASYLSKVLPGGVGGAGLNVRFLTKAGMEPTEVTAVIATQGIIGFLMFIIPVALFLFMQGGNVGELFSFHVPRWVILSSGLAVLFLASLLALSARIRRFVVAKINDFISGIREIATSPRDLTWAALASFGVTAAYILCLYAAMQIVGVHLGVTAAVLVYITAIVAKSTIPTPGGLGPLEVAMVATFVTLGISKGEALSVVVLYRLATYWLPIPFSLWAYKYLSGKGMI